MTTSKIIAIVAGFFMLAGVAQAQVVSPLGNGDPLAVTQAWGLTGYQTPRVKPGTIIYSMTTGKQIDICPIWYPIAGCFDLSRTSYYLNSIGAR